MVDPKAETRLWSEVLLQALEDAMRYSDSNISSAQYAASSQVKGWIGTRDFHYLCGLAGIHSNMALRVFERVIDGDVVEYHRVKKALSFKHKNSDRTKYYDI